MMDEFKLQFSPALLKGGSMKMRAGLAGKYYVAAFVQGRQIVPHESKMKHKRSTDAILYSHRVIERYRRLAAVAFQQYLEKVNEVENVAAG